MVLDDQEKTFETLKLFHPVGAPRDVPLPLVDGVIGPPSLSQSDSPHPVSTGRELESGEPGRGVGIFKEKKHDFSSLQDL